MKMTVYYYSGTGNSLWTAKAIAEFFENSKIINMTDDFTEEPSGVVGFVFPVHMWGVPHRVIEFVNKLNLESSTFCFAVAVNAGQVSRTLIQFKSLLKKRGILLSLGYDIKLPSNYIPWGGPGSKEEINMRIETSETKIENIIKEIKDKAELKIEKGPLWQRIIFTALYKLSFKQVPMMDKKFSVDDNCNECGICENVCISNNISMKDNRPVWNQNCEQCLACIQWCPTKAIQYGPKTINYERYHHPQIKLSEMILKK